MSCIQKEGTLYLSHPLIRLIMHAPKKQRALFCPLFSPLWNNSSQHVLGNSTGVYANILSWIQHSFLHTHFHSFFLFRRTLTRGGNGRRYRPLKSLVSKIAHTCIQGSVFPHSKSYASQGLKARGNISVISSLSIRSRIIKHRHIWQMTVFDIFPTDSVPSKDHLVTIPHGGWSNHLNPVDITIQFML